MSAVERDRRAVTANRAPLDILIINWLDRRNPQAGGAELHLHEIFGRLARRGHRVRLLASGWRGAAREERLDGIGVRRSGRRNTFPLTVGTAYRAARREAPIDVVVEDINKLPLFTPVWVREPVIALVPHLFGETAFREVAWPVATTVWAAERIMPFTYRGVPFQAISRSTARDLARRGFARDQIEVIPPGIDHRRFRPDSGVEKFERPTAVYLGRLKRYKELDVVIRAFRRVVRAGIDARLLVAGRGDDRERLEEVTSRERVRDRVEFLGFVSEDQKVELLRRAWVVVYPSPKEGWGIAAVEAAACGTPTIASDSPGLRDSVADGESGFLVAHRDEEAWAEHLLRFFGDPDLRGRMGRQAVVHARSFSWDRAADRTERSLIEVCKSRGGK